jgi:hypothetical protein
MKIHPAGMGGYVKLVSPEDWTRGRKEVNEYMRGEILLPVQVATFSRTCKELNWEQKFGAPDLLVPYGYHAGADALLANIETKTKGRRQVGPRTKEFRALRDSISVYLNVRGGPIGLKERRLKDVKSMSGMAKDFDSMSPTVLGDYEVGRNCFDLIDGVKPCAFSAFKMLKWEMAKTQGRKIFVVYKGMRTWEALGGHPTHHHTVVDVADMLVFRLMLQREHDIAYKRPFVISQKEMALLEADEQVEPPTLIRAWTKFCKRTLLEITVMKTRQGDSRAQAEMALDLYFAVCQFGEEHQEELDLLLRMELTAEAFSVLLDPVILPKGGCPVTRGVRAAHVRGTLVQRGCSAGCYHSLPTDVPM